jgi:predicted RNA methylase
LRWWRYRAGDIVEAAKVLSKMRLRFPRVSGKTFRVVMMDRGKLRPLPENIMNGLEIKVARQTGLSPHRANPDVEIWLNRRNTGDVFFMVRIGKHASFDKALKKGELRPDIVSVMLHEARIGKDSVVADLFGGWGAVAAALAEKGTYKAIHTGDINDECVEYQRKRLKGKRDCFVYKWDALDVPLGDGTVDAIITDPPWGEYEKINIPDFYGMFIKEAKRILTKKGKLVFLSSAFYEAGKALEKYNVAYSYIPTKINGKNTFLFTAEA